jgi:multidrug efflux system membrane fusion protein
MFPCYCWHWLPVAGGGAVIALHGWRPPKRGGGPVAVAVAPVTQQDAPLQLGALGTVTATNTVTVHSRVDGQLMALHFDEGQLVQKGQLLAELDPRPFQAALTQAEGQLMRDQALLQNARLDLTRYQQLLAQNSIAKQQVDTQQALVAQYQGTVKLDQGAVATARLQLDYSRITRPCPAVPACVRSTWAISCIQRQQRRGGDYPDPAHQCTVCHPGNQPQPGAGGPGSQGQAAGGSLGPRQPPQAGRWRIAGHRQSTEHHHRHGQPEGALCQCRCCLVPQPVRQCASATGVQPNATVLPSVALQQGKVGSYVYTVNPDQTVSISKVKTGAVSGDNTIIEEGVKAGQKVVVDGLDKLREGRRSRLSTVPRKARQMEWQRQGQGQAACGQWQLGRPAPARLGRQLSAG